MIRVVNAEPSIPKTTCGVTRCVMLNTPKRLMRMSCRYCIWGGAVGFDTRVIDPYHTINIKSLVISGLQIMINRGTA